MADIEKVQMLVNQCKQILKDHPYDESDAMSYIISMSLFHDEMKFIIKALEDLQSRMSFDSIDVIE